jgi:hypothetical protein
MGEERIQMNELFSVLFGGAGVAVVSWLISYFWTRARFRRILFLDRASVDKELGGVEERFDNAREEVWISGNDCAFVAVAESPKVEKLLDRKVRVKILVVDPDSAAPAMLAKIDPRFPTEAAFKESMATVKSGLRELKRKYPQHFEYRLLPILPAMGFFIIDPHSEEGIVKFEIYTAKDWKPIDSRPHLIIKRKEKLWRNYFLDQWKNYWELGNEDAQQTYGAATQESAPSAAP